ncbi:MAG TPA: copper chaperone PCu(A)C, partial [Candidatus Limnocylindrales bacterium]
VRTARGHGRIVLLTIVSLALVGACSSSAASPSASAAPASSAASGGISVTGAWVRNSTAMTGALAGYLVITNSGSTADTLLKASSPAAKTVQLHETVPVSPMPSASGGGMASAMPSPGGMGMGSAMPAASGTGGMMTMVEVDKVDIPAGGTVEFKPGGYHIMFMDLTDTLAADQTIDLTLTFANAGPITVKAEVRAQ